MRHRASGNGAALFGGGGGIGVTRRRLSAKGSVGARVRAARGRAAQRFPEVARVRVTARGIDLERAREDGVERGRDARA
jgi:hypothetical protein